MRDFLGLVATSMHTPKKRWSQDQCLYNNYAGNKQAIASTTAIASNKDRLFLEHMQLVGANQ